MGMHKFKIFIFYTGVLSQENKQEHQYKQDDRNAIYSKQDDKPPPPSREAFYRLKIAE